MLLMVFAPEGALGWRSKQVTRQGART